MKKLIQKWLGIESNTDRIETIENLILHQDSKWNGYAVLKRHLNRPDKPLPTFAGKEIGQD